MKVLTPPLLNTEIIVNIQVVGNIHLNLLWLLLFNHLKLLLFNHLK